MQRIPFTKIASSLGDVRVANMVSLGAYLKVKNILKRETILEVFSEITAPSKKHLIEINKQALEKGYRAW